MINNWPVTHLIIACVTLSSLFTEHLNCQIMGDHIDQEVTHHYTDGEVKIHYVSIGEGPLLVMLHGFPDYWYTWRHQMQTLRDHFRVVAVDLRGYNRSDQPQGVDQYKMQLLLEDIEAVIHHCQEQEAIIVGHDWGGAISWQLALHKPHLVKKLIVCNMTHPTGYTTASLAKLQANDNQSYMDDFRKHTKETLSLDWLTGWVKDSAAQLKYREAFARSDIDGMLNYYRANSPTKAQRAEWLKNPRIKDQPKIKVPVLILFGLKDQFVPKEGLNNTWNWIDGPLTIVTFPSAGHFVQQDAAATVGIKMLHWLLPQK